jgi:hypothetical protein
MKKDVFIVISFSFCLFFAPLRGMSQEASPFGVCMHIGGGGEEYNQMPENLRMVHDAGIRWVRADFSWSSVESTQGTWNFDELDRVVAETQKQGLHILAPLLYDVPWANPAYEHLDAWLTYVEKVVTRYRDRVRHWEVWNEPNLFPRFWNKRDDAANYTLLLEATYKKIKEIDPQLVVVHAGTAGIPMDYIEKSFAAGSGKFFDKMAVHPYRPPMNTWDETVRFKDDIDRLRALMAKYGLDRKDLWFTEMGMSSMTSVETVSRDVFHEAKAETGKDWTVAVVCDEDFPPPPAFSAQTLRAFFPAGFRVDTIQILDMRRIRLSDYDAVFFPPSDNYPLHISQTVTPCLTGYLRSRGKIYCCTANGDLYGYTDTAEKERTQAIYVAQSLCLSLRFGIERYFCYEMESPERNIFDREDNFGLTRRGLNPKVAYRAYAIIGELFPAGSKIDASVEWRQQDCCVVSWIQPDGTRVWAVWSPEGVRQLRVTIGNGLRDAFNCAGGILPAITQKSTTFKVGEAAVYLVGAESFTIQESSTQ